MKTITTCLLFETGAEAAAHFYAKTFPDSRIVKVSHYPKADASSAARVLAVELDVAGEPFVLVNGPQVKPTPSISFFVNLKDAAEVERIYGALLEGGSALMPLGTYRWSQKYGWVQDRFGFTWQVMLAKQPPASVIAPCLMFSDANVGRAEEAIRRYVSLLPDSRVESIEHYAAGEGPQNYVKHGRFALAGKQMVAMDSPMPHGFGFNEAVSFQVMCKDQKQVDHYWKVLAEGGRESRCGWLEDRYGVSLQVVPDRMSAMMSSPDAAAQKRAFDTMVTMTKLEIAKLEKAFAGG